MYFFPLPIFLGLFIRDSPCAHLALESRQRFGACVTSYRYVYIYVNSIPYLLISQQAVIFYELD